MAKANLVRSQTEIRNIIGNGRKGDPCYKVAKSLAKLCLCPSVLWNAELVSNKIGYLAGPISKQSVEGKAWFLLNAYSKIQEERSDLKTKWSTNQSSLSLFRPHRSCKI